MTPRLLAVPAYLRELIGQLQEKYDPQRKILFQLEADNFELNTAQATAVAIILTEALENSLQHAFDSEHPDKRIEISMRLFASDIALMISDNGQGKINDPIPGRGSARIHTAVEELGGTMKMVSGQGFYLLVDFKKR